MSCDNTSTASESEHKSSFNLEIVARSERKKLLSTIADALTGDVPLAAMITVEDTLKVEKDLVERVNCRMF